MLANIFHQALQYNQISKNISRPAAKVDESLSEMYNQD